MGKCIEKNFTDLKEEGLQDLFVSDKQNDVGENIKRVLESGGYSKYIRIPKSLQDYLVLWDMIHKEMSEQIQKVELETWRGYTDSLIKFDRGLRRETKILEQRMNDEQKGEIINEIT